VSLTSPAARAARGKEARKRRPRSSLGRWAPASDRPDPIGLLEEQAATRVPELVPIRYGRMAASPFAFFRGAAAVMSWDLSQDASSGLEVQLCGDAHLSNFGGFAAPDRRLVFDINDFDETHPGPFEWDLQRLAASVEIAGRASGMEAGDRDGAVRSAARSYRRAIRVFAGQTNLDVWSARLHAEDLPDFVGEDASAALVEDAMARLGRAAAKAKRKDRFKALARLTQQSEGELRFVSDPPLLVPVEELVDVDAEMLEKTMLDLIVHYRATLLDRDRVLLDQYTYRHIARKVVGVGSVGTRAWVLLLTGRDDDDPLFLQVKQAEASVLERFTRPSTFENHGQRVVVGQRLMQAASDVFLGWDRFSGQDGVTRDFYLRQLWDWKASADIGSMSPSLLAVYSAVCGWTLARAHARTGDRIAIASYLGGSSTFDQALASFASGYADRNEHDHGRLVDAIASGRLDAQEGI
jgi:uncharacterized protein (DUF2252 family)